MARRTAGRFPRWAISWKGAIELKAAKKRRLSLSQKKSISGYLFILPWLVGFIVFYVRSLIMTGQFAFSELTVDTVNGGYSLRNVGWDNFYYAFRVHATFKQVLTTSVLDMIIDVPLVIFFSLFIAMLLNREFKGRAIVRAIFFLPVILNTEAVQAALDLSSAMMTGGISSEVAEVAESAAGTLAFSVDYIIDMFTTLGLPASIVDYIVQAVARINDIISASGVQIVIFIAALQSIPSSMYEVAKIEGATGYETFWKVTFPMVMPHIVTNILYTIVDSYTDSSVVDLAYDVAFSEFNYGLSSVFSLVSTVVTCLILVLICGIIQKRTFYYN